MNNIQHYIYTRIYTHIAKNTDFVRFQLACGRKRKINFVADGRSPMEEKRRNEDVCFGL